MNTNLLYKTDKIVKFETFRWEQEPRCIWVEVTTQNGLVGLGETYWLPGAVEAVIHDMIAPLLLGKDPGDIESHWSTLFNCVNFYGYAGAEMRAISAVDVALWDLLGQAVQKPIYSLLGGKVRDRILVYNTCTNGRHFHDHDAVLTKPDELALELLDQGIRAMKIFPFDQFLPAIQHLQSPLYDSGLGKTMGPIGHALTLEQLREGLKIVEKIRKATGDKMEMMIEGHGRWDLNSAIKIGRGLEEYEPFWMEDMMQPDSADDLARLAESCRVPQAVSERLFTKNQYRHVLEKKAAHFLLIDVLWTGGITESKKLAAMADAYHLAIAPHDCTGPVTIFASLHLCASCSNTAVMETNRAFYQQGYYSDVVTNPVTTHEGMIEFPTIPGLGTALQSEFKKRKDVSTRVSTVSLN